MLLHSYFNSDWLNIYARLSIDTLLIVGLNLVFLLRYRHCFPIITGIIADYEEQVLLTGIKSGRHCTICQVPPWERENLQKRWPKRSHAYTQELIAWQRQLGSLSDIDKEDKAMMVHDVDCFTWSHPYTNIHTAMMVDMLHQLLKGIIHYLI